MKKIQNNKFVLLTFLLSFGVLMIVFSEKGMYPFGDRQIMIIDSWHQYFPIFKELHNRLTTGGSLLYSWNSGLGTNFLTMIGYYAMSPLNILSILCPKDYLREFFWVITLVKISLAGTFFSYYLKKVYGRHDLGITVFGLLYSFCGFLMGYYWNIMWLDSVALLPLVILGLHYVVNESKYMFYTIVLAIILTSNFYVGIFVCIFIAFYFFVLYFDKYGLKGFNHLISKVIEIACFSFIGIALAAFILFPIFMGMSKVYDYSASDPTKITTYNTMIETINNLLFYQKSTIVDGLPNIFSGVLSLVLLPLYFVNTSIMKRSKVLNGALLGFLFLSLNINVLNFMWHGFRFTNQVPFRFSFVISFLIITLSYRGFIEIKKNSFKELFYVCVFFILYLLFNENIFEGTVDFKVFYLTGFFILLYLGLFYLYKNKHVSEMVLSIILVVIVMIEGGVGFLESTKLGGDSGRDHYYPQLEEINDSLEYLKNTDDDFYRMELYNTVTVNDAIHYDYRGISQFASTANAVTNQFTLQMGMPSDPGANTYTYKPSTPSLNGMFNVKYLLSRDNAVPEPNEAYEMVFESGGVRVLENKFSLPLGFMIDPLTFNLNEHLISPFERQEEFYQIATGFDKKFYENLQPFKESHSNIVVDSNEGIRFHYHNVDKSREGRAKLLYKPEVTDQLYVYVLNQNPDVDLKVGEKVSRHTPYKGIIVDIGVVEKDTVIEIAFDVNAMDGGFFDVGVVAFNELIFTEYVNELKEESMEVTSYSDTSIKGVVNVEENGFLYTSIPYDEGWTVEVNNKKVSIDPFQDALITVPLYEGENTIVMKYVPKGIVSGGTVSVFAILLLVVLNILDWRKRRRNNEVITKQDISTNHTGV